MNRWTDPDWVEATKRQLEHGRALVWFWGSVALALVVAVVAWWAW